MLYTEKVSYTNIGPIAHRNRTALNGGGRDKVEVGIRRESGQDYNYISIHLQILCNKQKIVKIKKDLEANHFNINFDDRGVHEPLSKYAIAIANVMRTFTVCPHSWFYRPHEPLLIDHNLIPFWYT